MLRIFSRDDIERILQGDHHPQLENKTTKEIFFINIIFLLKNNTNQKYNLNRNIPKQEKISLKCS